MGPKTPNQNNSEQTEADIVEMPATTMPQVAPPDVKTDFNVNGIKLSIIMCNQIIKELEKQGTTDPFDFEMEIMEKLPEFYQSHPFLIKKICKKEDISMLEKMFSQLELIQSGQTSMTSVEAKLGNELANQYLGKFHKK